jgi:hypothetical protein
MKSSNPVILTNSNVSVVVSGVTVLTGKHAEYSLGTVCSKI